MCLFYLSKRLNVVARLRPGVLTVCIYKCLATTVDRWLRDKSGNLHRTFSWCFCNAHRSVTWEEPHLALEVLCSERECRCSRGLTSGFCVTWPPNPLVFWAPRSSTRTSPRGRARSTSSVSWPCYLISLTQVRRAASHALFSVPCSANT